MRVFTFQSRVFTEALLSSLNTYGYVDSVTVKDFIDTEVDLSKRDIYNGADFIFTFYNRGFQQPYKPINFLLLTAFDLHFVIKGFTACDLTKSISIIELEIPEEEGIFGKLGMSYDAQGSATREEADTLDEGSRSFHPVPSKVPDWKLYHDYEFVIPKIKSEWLVDVYDLNLCHYKGIKVNHKTGFSIVSRNLTSMEKMLTEEYSQIGDINETVKMSDDEDKSSCREIMLELKEKSRIKLSELTNGDSECDKFDFGQMMTAFDWS